MATVTQAFLPDEAVLPAANFHIPKKINGTNNSFKVLQFAGDAKEAYRLAEDGTWLLFQSHFCGAAA